MGHMQSRHSTRTDGWLQGDAPRSCTWDVAVNRTRSMQSRTDLKVKDPLRPFGKGLANLAHNINSCLA